MFTLSRKGVSPVIAIVLLLMMTVAAAGAAYFWLTSMQSSMQESSRKSIENIMEASGRRVVAQGTLCKPTYPYKGLVGYWMMDEGSGGYANDSSKYENDGMIHGTNWTDGNVGRALDFDGSDDYVELGNAFDPSTSGTSQTVALWAKPNTVPVYGFMVSSWVSDFWCFNLKYVGKFEYAIRDSSNTHLKIASSSYPVGSWYFVVAVANAVTGEMKLYVNGDQVDSSSGWNGTWNGGSKKEWINYKADSKSSDFDGKIDEVRIYDRALSENEIQELYEAENHSARRRIDVTVRNIGSEEIPKATWVANLKHDGTNVETDAYNASSIGTGELKTLKFYFKEFKPNTEYTIQLQGTGTSTTVSC